MARLPLGQIEPHPTSGLVLTRQVFPHQIGTHQADRESEEGPASGPRVGPSDGAAGPSVSAAAEAAACEEQRTAGGGGKAGKAGGGGSKREEGTRAGTHRLLCFCERHRALASEAQVAEASFSSSAATPPAGPSAPRRRRIFSAFQEEQRAGAEGAPKTGSGASTIPTPTGDADRVMPSVVRMQPPLSQWPRGKKIPETLVHDFGSARCVHIVNVQNVVLQSLALTLCQPH